MSPFKRAHRRHARVLLAAYLLGPLFLGGLAGPVSAECNPPGADVSFVRTAPYAQRILVGRVVDAQPDPDGRGSGQDGVTFTLEVQRVLRGPSTAELLVDQLETGGCNRWLVAADGDVIALAFETRGSHPRLASATAAWIEGRPRTGDPYEVMTMAEVLDAAALPRPPDTATVAVHGNSRSVSWLAVGATIVGSLAMFLTTGRRLTAPAGRGQRRSK
jgi:hypothetical protein